jgi:hypothetical protein
MDDAKLPRENQRRTGITFLKFYGEAHGGQSEFRHTKSETEWDVPLIKSFGEVRVVLQRIETYCDWRIEDAEEDPPRTRRMLETKAIANGRNWRWGD